MGNLRPKTWLWLLFIGYCGMMLWLLLLHRVGAGPGVGQVNLQPMETVRRYLWVLRHSTDPDQWSNAAANLLGNVGLFTPLGVFLPLLFSALRRFWRVLLLTLLLILALELTQAVTGLGTFDVDDLILNLLGVFLGYLLYRCFLKCPCGGEV